MLYAATACTDGAVPCFYQPGQLTAMSIVATSTVPHGLPYGSWKASVLLLKYLKIYFNCVGPCKSAVRERVKWVADGAMIEGPTMSAHKWRSQAQVRLTSPDYKCWSSVNDAYQPGTQRDGYGSGVSGLTRSTAKCISRRVVTSLGRK